MTVPAAYGSMLRIANPLILCLIIAQSMITLDRVSCCAQDPPDEAEQVNRPTGDAGLRSGHLVKIGLPITGTVDQELVQRIDPLLEQLPTDGPRPILVLQFETRSENGTGPSQFERCLAIARYLSSSRLSRVKAVAYLPEDVKGHAVLPVLACEEIVMAPDAQLGPAAAPGERVDDTMRNSYQQIAERRRVIPVAFALGLLDQGVAVYRVTGGGVRYVLEEERRQLESEGEGNVVDTVKQAGQLSSYTGTELRHNYKFVSHLVSDRLELIRVLRLDADALQLSQSTEGSWNAVQVELRGEVNRRAVDWTIRSLEQQWKSDRPDFLCVRIDSPGGSPEDSVRLASWLAGLQPEEVRTVAFVTDQARGDAALVALSCDQLVMGRQAQLGGPGATILDTASAEDLRSVVQRLSRELGRQWSLTAAMVDPSLVVNRYRHADTAVVRYFCEDELEEQPDSERWRKEGTQETEDGLSGVQAHELGLARHLADDFAAFRRLYKLTEDPRPLEPAWKDVWVERLAEMLATPMVAGLLLFAAWFFLSAEMSQPGLGAPGFAACLCFTLFFWSQFLNGTAGWLEVLLFLVGVGCIAIEIFVVPGVGAFGIGGAVMIVLSIVLASQSFVIPRNAYQLGQLPTSLSLVLAAIAGIFVSLALMRHLLPEAPYLNRMMLEPPKDDEEVEINQREALVHLEYLAGKKGTTTTQLTPSGKARFGDDVVDVISRGEVIASGADVRVVDVRGSRVLVESIERNV